MGNLLKQRCDIYGVESGGATRMLGGLSASKPGVQFFCESEAVATYRMTCAHGHRGQKMPLCGKHFLQYNGKVSFCPRCNNEPPGHKCTLTLVEVS